MDAENMPTAKNFNKMRRLEIGEKADYNVTTFDNGWTLSEAWIYPMGKEREHVMHEWKPPLTPDKI